MTQLFKPSVNNVAKLSILGGALITLVALTILLVSDRSRYVARAGVAVAQPVRFSHVLHSDSLNIGCRYCHTSVEDSAFAGIPDTQTCMTCHSHILTASPLLQSVRDSWANNQPIAWNKVHNLAQHAYFNHSVHVTQGFACETCHGRVDQMPVVWQAQPMSMQFCLDCHWNPQNYIRPVSEVYTFGYTPAIPQAELGPQLVKEYGIRNSEALVECYVCHR